MAAVEARAAWQRTANRYFVQEDAKRAPKLACGTSSLTSKLQVDVGTSDIPNPLGHPAAGFMRLGWNSSNSNLSPDTKWWLQMQQNSVYQKDFTFQQLNTLDAEQELSRAEEVNETLKSREDSIQFYTNKSTESSLEPNLKAFVHCVEHDQKSKMQGLKVLYSISECSIKQYGMEYSNNDEEEIVDLNCLDQLISDQYEKTEPWWRTADKDELALLVAQKSLDHIENCDLPPVQARNVRRCTYDCPDSFCKGGNSSLPLDQEVHIGLVYKRIDGNQWASSEKGHFLYDPDKPFRKTNSDLTEAWNTNSESTQSKEQILKALRHSQTRARVAEKAVKKACNEKQHIIELIFRQTSHLFAYNQWIQLLQLETICHQFKHQEDQDISSAPFSVNLPSKSTQWKKSKHRIREGKKKCQLIYEMTKKAVAFAVGLGLVGAGLVLGWTIGWLLLRF